MITVIERSGGYTVANDGHAVMHLTRDQADELYAKLADARNPVTTAAVTPAKAVARSRPQIMRYPV